MDRGVWQVIAHGVAKESDTTAHAGLGGKGKGKWREERKGQGG